MRLLMAYLRRVRWQHQDLAVHIVNALGEALGGGKAGGNPKTERVAPKELFRQMGINK